MFISKCIRAVFTAIAFVSISLFSASTLAAKTDQKPAAVASKVSINKASANVLSDALDGVGLKKARAIVAYREAHGRFKNIQELTLVKGIGEATLEKNKAKLTL